MSDLTATISFGRKRGWKILVLVTAATGLALGLAEALCRLLLPAPGFVPFSPHEHGLVRPHPTRSFSYRPGVSTKVRVAEREIAVAFNSLGLRDDPVAPEDRSEPRILAVGDSFTTGFGVEASEAWPEQLERLLEVRLPARSRFRVINAGISGYGLRQMRDLTEELLPLLEPELVVVGIFVRGHDRLNDPYVYFHGGVIRESRLPKVEAVEGGVLITPFYQPWARRLGFWLDRHFHFGALLLETAQRERSRLGSRRASEPRPPLTAEWSEAALAPLRDELGRIEELIAARGIPLVALLIDEQEADGGFGADQPLLNDAIARFAAKQGIPLVDPLPALRASAGGKPTLRLGTDSHWSPLAHRLAAEELAGYLVADGLLSTPPSAATR